LPAGDRLVVLRRVDAEDRSALRQPLRRLGGPPPWVSELDRRHVDRRERGPEQRGGPGRLAFAAYRLALRRAQQLTIEPDRRDGQAPVRGTPKARYYQDWVVARGEKPPVP
jgi:hypothetical protein